MEAERAEWSETHSFDIQRCLADIEVIQLNLYKTRKSSIGHTQIQLNRDPFSAFSNTLCNPPAWVDP